LDSKKLIVISDTHGGVGILKRVLTWAKERTPPHDTILAAVFLGDGISDLKQAADASGFDSTWIIVNGNNDYNYSLPETAVFDFADNTFFACHGHRHSLYGGYHTLAASAKNAGANFALFGHAHVPVYKILDGITLINPGSAARPRSKIGATFAVLTFTDNKLFEVEFFGIDAKGGIKGGIEVN